MKIAIVQFPGATGEREMCLAVKRANMEPVEFLWNESREKLRQMDGVIIVGGSSYGDRPRPGVIAALDPVMQEIKSLSELGKPILGVGNGAHILVESGLVPGLENNYVGIALTDNKGVIGDRIFPSSYCNASLYIRLSNHYQRNAFTRHAVGKVLSMPIATSAGCFAMTRALLQEIEMQGLNVFQYCDGTGNVTEEFSINPSGSIANMAAISNKKGNVLAMIPHPERSADGDGIFQSMRDYIATGRVEQVSSLNYYPRKPAVLSYQRPPSGDNQVFEFITELIATDKDAQVVQDALRHLGLPVMVKRQIHWEIECNDQKAFQQIKQSGILFDENKEQECCSHHVTQANSSLPDDLVAKSYLVRGKEDVLGERGLQVMKNNFPTVDIHAVRYGVLWHFIGESSELSELQECLLQTNIICNPISHHLFIF